MELGSLHSPINGHNYDQLSIFIDYFFSIGAETITIGNATDVMTSGMLPIGPGTGPILLDDVRCSGLEYRLFDCPHNGIDVSNCGHHQDAAVMCVVGKKIQNSIDCLIFYQLSPFLLPYNSHKLNGNRVFGPGTDTCP